MVKTFNLIVFIFAAFPSSIATNQPNIIFFLVDDLGWNNVGYHALNNETKTPNIDKLATNEGLQLNKHYVKHFHLLLIIYHHELNLNLLVNFACNIK